MRKLLVHEFITLDGVIQAPGGKDEDTDGGFNNGGWSRPFWHDDIGTAFFAAMETAGALLLGRRTWSIHSVFEHMDDPFARALTAMPKYVVSTTLKSADAWRNSTIINANVEEEVRKLKSMPGKNILTDGSSRLLRTLISDDLVDEYMLHVYPISLGSGKKLFPEGKRVDLTLLDTVRIPTGVLYLHYQRREPKQ